MFQRFRLFFCFSLACLLVGQSVDPVAGSRNQAERLEWSQWGGYAQGYSSAKIPFASAGLASIWEKARNEDLHIPRFAHGGGRRLMPGSSIKGAFRTAWLSGTIDPEKARQLWLSCAAEGLRWKTLSALDASILLWIAWSLAACRAASAAGFGTGTGTGVGGGPQSLHLLS